MLNRTLKTTLLATAVALSAPALSAATLTVNSVTGAWQNTVLSNGGSATGETTNTISWGAPVSSEGQSSYSFNGTGAGTFDDGIDFGLGTFTHNNFPIFEPLLETADLVVTIDVAGYGAIETLFNFEHSETPNGANPCEFGGNNGQGINDNGCADQVAATLNLGSSDTFTIDDIEYVFNVSGFQHGGSLFDSFLTVEGQSNQANLIGSFVAVDTLETVPLPASGLMLLAAAGAAGFASRRKSKASA